MIPSAIGQKVTESPYFRFTGESIDCAKTGRRVLQFTQFTSHDDIAHRMATIMTAHLNDRAAEFATASRHPLARYYTAMWWGIDFEDPAQPEARFIGVFDRRHPHPENGMFSMTKFGTDPAENAAILGSSLIAAEALNLVCFDWTPPLA